MEEDSVKELSYIGAISSTVHISEPALCLLISLFIGYPLALVHRYTLSNKYPNLQHAFFIASGFGLGYFNYGQDVLHSTMSVLGVYLILLTMGGTALSVFLVFVFSMGYLMCSYYVTETEDYDIKWSMAQCVLTLKLVGIVFDFYDGARPPEELSEERRNTALREVPTFLEVAGFTYYPAGFLVGPQFSFARYKSFVSGTLRPDGGLPDSLRAGFLRGALGCVYLLTYQIVELSLPDCHLLSEEYQTTPLWWKCVVLGLWGKKSLHKYVACWLITEGACIVMGLSYNGVDSDGLERWDGCSNVDLGVFEDASRFGDYVASFNINTNKWVGQYMYKRFKFLGNPNISRALTLVFLAFWHGLHTGYYMCFALEYFMLLFEKDLVDTLHKNNRLTLCLQRPELKPMLWLVRKIYVFVFMGYCLVPFVLLSFSRWWQVYRSLHFIGHIMLVTWFIYAPFVRYFLTPRHTQHVE